MTCVVFTGTDFKKPVASLGSNVSALLVTTSYHHAVAGGSVISPRTPRFYYVLVQPIRYRLVVPSLFQLLRSTFAQSYFLMKVRLTCCLPCGPSTVSSIRSVLPSAESVQRRVI